MADFEVWDPWEQMRRMQNKMRKAFRNWPYEVSRGGIRQPLSDLSDKGDRFELVMELPGVDKKDIQINIMPEYVSIGAEQKTTAKEEKEEEGYYFHERSYQKFFRQIPLPEPIVPQKTTAKMNNGILEIRLIKEKPTKPKVEGHTVEVK